MKKKLTYKDRYKFFLVDTLSIKRPRVYKRGFRTKADALYAKNMMPNYKTLITLQGFEILTHKGGYTMVPYKGRLLRPSEYLKSNPNSEKRVRRARTILKRYPGIRELMGAGISRSQVLNTLAREFLTS